MRTNPYPYPVQLRRHVRTALAVAIVAAAAVGCGSDDDTVDDASLSPAACDAFATINAAMFGDPSGVDSAADALVEGASADLTDSAETYAEALVAGMGGDETALEGADVAAAIEDIGTAATETCDTVASVDVSGIDYAYEGLPDQIPMGRTAFDFTNDTASGEAHEMLILRRVEGADESVTELLELPEDELFSKVVPAAVVFADDAGASGHALVDLDAGEYIAICMIPTAGDGPPHAVNGMVDEFTVS